MKKDCLKKKKEEKKKYIKVNKQDAACTLVLRVQPKS